MCVSGCKKVKTEKINYAFDEISEKNKERGYYVLSALTAPICQAEHSNSVNVQNSKVQLTLLIKF